MTTQHSSLDGSSKNSIIKSNHTKNSKSKKKDDNVSNESDYMFHLHHHQTMGFVGGGGIGDDGIGMRRLSLTPQPHYSFFDATTTASTKATSSSSGGDMMFKASPTPLKSLSDSTPYLDCTTTAATTTTTAINSMGCNTGCFPPSLQTSSSEPPMIPSGVVAYDNMDPLLKLKEHKRRPPSSYKATSSRDDTQLVSFPATYTLSSKDIMCGRHKRAMNHSGNRRFRALIASYLPRYFEFPTRIDRAILALDIVEALDESGGYFLRQNKQTGIWTELSSKEKRDKVGHALRDAAAAASNNSAASSNGSVSSHASSTAIKKKQETTKNRKATASPTTKKRPTSRKKTISAPNLGELMDIPTTVQTTADDTQSVPDSHTLAKKSTSSSLIPEFTPSGVSLSEDDDELSSIDGVVVTTMKIESSDLVDLDVFIDPFNTDEPEAITPSATTTTATAAQQQHHTTNPLSHLLQADFLEF